MSSLRELSALEADGKIGRLLRTRKCPECLGVETLSYSSHSSYYDGGHCSYCGGSGRVGVYAKVNQSAEQPETDKDLQP
jgi:hypothetical protein